MSVEVGNLEKYSKQIGRRFNLDKTDKICGPASLAIEWTQADRWSQAELERYRWGQNFEDAPVGADTRTIRRKHRA